MGSEERCIRYRGLCRDRQALFSLFTWICVLVITVSRTRGVEDISERSSEREIYRQPAEAARKTHPRQGAIVWSANAEEYQPGHQLARQCS